MTFYNDFVPKNNRRITHYAEKRRDSITLSTLAIKGGGGRFITGWAQRVNGSYSLFNIKDVWTLEGSVSVSFRFLQPRRVSVPGFDQQEEETDRGGGGGRGEPQHLWVSLLPWKPCLAYLTPVLVTSHARIVHSKSEKFFSIQYPPGLQRQANGVCVCVWWFGGGGGGLWDNND